MAHTRIWEEENDFCYYEESQLQNLILAWEPEYSNFLIDDFDYALGIYTEKYFSPSYYGRLAYSRTPEENSISILKLRNYRTGNKFTFMDNERMTVFYDFERKLWNDSNLRQNMFNIDRQLIQNKISEFEQIPATRFIPLSFSVKTNTVAEIFQSYGLTLD